MYEKLRWGSSLIAVALRALITILSYGFPNDFHGTVVLLYTVYSGWAI